jgi:polyhydroxyalkanoate synthesis regulator phasin
MSTNGGTQTLGDLLAQIRATRLNLDDTEINWAQVIGEVLADTELRLTKQFSEQCHALEQRVAALESLGCELKDRDE